MSQHNFSADEHVVKHERVELRDNVTSLDALGTQIAKVAMRLHHLLPQSFDAVHRDATPQPRTLGEALEHAINGPTNTSPVVGISVCRGCLAASVHEAEVLLGYLRDLQELSKHATPAT